MQLYENFRNFIYAYICYLLKLNQIHISFCFIKHCLTMRCFHSTHTRNCTPNFCGTDRWNTPYYQQLPDVWIKSCFSVFQSFQQSIRWFHDVARLFWRKYRVVPRCGTTVFKKVSGVPRCGTTISKKVSGSSTMWHDCSQERIKWFHDVAWMFSRKYQVIPRCGTTVLKKESGGSTMWHHCFPSTRASFAFVALVEYSTLDIEYFVYILISLLKVFYQ